MTGRPASTGLTAEQDQVDAIARGLGKTPESGLPDWFAVARVALKALAESGYAIVPRPDGEERDAVASALAIANDYDPNQVPTQLWGAVRDRYLNLADVAISTLTAYREGQDG